MTRNNTQWLDKLYRRLNREKGKRVCTGISEDACKQAPRNYFIILLSNLFTGLADTLSNPKTVLTWLMSYIHAPVYLISLIVPLRESGSMLPQIILADYVKQKNIRKWLWVTGIILQGLMVIAMGLVALYTHGVIAGWLIIILLVVFSLSRALSSIASKDVLGKTIPKTRRGKLKGYTTSLSGVLVLAAALYIIYHSKTEQNSSFYTSIIFFSGILWMIAALIFSRVKEFPSEPVESVTKGNTLQKFKRLITEKTFRRFIISRALLLVSALSSPFYVLLAHAYVGKDSYLLGLIIMANGLASIISSPFWGRLTDKSSKTAMALGGFIASVLGLVMFIIIVMLPELRSKPWLYPVAFFILGIAHTGVRLGRKTYVVDMAKGNQRTDYVAISNTIIGLILLFTGGISALASLVSVESVILGLSLLGIIGAVSSYRLPNVEQE